jgi:NIMA (never in mitosis gene a)-related kinase
MLSDTNRLLLTSPLNHSGTFWSNLDSIVMEFSTNGDLAAKIAKHAQQGTQVPEETIWNIFIQLVKGLKQLH